MITTSKEPGMGRFSVDVELANNEDLSLAKSGHLKPEQVRRVRIRGVVDSGATRLVIPESVATQLGVPKSGQTAVRYADGRADQKTIVDNVHLELLGRSSVFRAIVEPDRNSILIGAIVMEDLDFLIDCVAQKLVPRDPDMIVSEIE